MLVGKRRRTLQTASSSTYHRCQGVTSWPQHSPYKAQHKRKRCAAPAPASPADVSAKYSWARASSGLHRRMGSNASSRASKSTAASPAAANLAGGGPTDVGWERGKPATKGLASSNDARGRCCESCSSGTQGRPCGCPALHSGQHRGGLYRSSSQHCPTPHLRYSMGARPGRWCRYRRQEGSCTAATSAQQGVPNTLKRACSGEEMAVKSVGLCADEVVIGVRVVMRKRETERGRE